MFINALRVTSEADKSTEVFRTQTGIGPNRAILVVADPGHLAHTAYRCINELFGKQKTGYAAEVAAHMSDDAGHTWIYHARGDGVLHVTCNGQAVEAGALEPFTLTEKTISVVDGTLCLDAVQTDVFGPLDEKVKELESELQAFGITGTIGAAQLSMVRQQGLRFYHDYQAHTRILETLAPERTPASPDDLESLRRQIAIIRQLKGNIKELQSLEVDARDRLNEKREVQARLAQLLDDCGLSKSKRWADQRWDSLLDRLMRMATLRMKVEGGDERARSILRRAMEILDGWYFRLHDKVASIQEKPVVAEEKKVQADLKRPTWFERFSQSRQEREGGQSELDLESISSPIKGELIFLQQFVHEVTEFRQSLDEEYGASEAAYQSHVQELHALETEWLNLCAAADLPTELTVDQVLEIIKISAEIAGLYQREQLATDHLARRKTLQLETEALIKEWRQLTHSQKSMALGSVSLVLSEGRGILQYESEREHRLKVLERAAASMESSEWLVRTISDAIRDTETRWNKLLASIGLRIELSDARAWRLLEVVNSLLEARSLWQGQAREPENPDRHIQVYRWIATDELSEKYLDGVFRLLRDDLTWPGPTILFMPGVPAKLVSELGASRLQWLQRVEKKDKKKEATPAKTVQDLSPKALSALKVLRGQSGALGDR